MMLAAFSGAVWLGTAWLLAVTIGKAIKLADQRSAVSTGSTGPDQELSPMLGVVMPVPREPIAG